MTAKSIAFSLLLALAVSFALMCVASAQEEAVPQPSGAAVSAPSSAAGGVAMEILKYMRKTTVYGMVYLMFLSLSFFIIIANFLIIRVSWLCPKGDCAKFTAMLKKGDIESMKRLVEKRYSFQANVLKAALKAGDIFNTKVDEQLEKEAVKIKVKPFPLLFIGVVSPIVAVVGVLFKWILYYRDITPVITDQGVPPAPHELMLVSALVLCFGFLMTAVTIPPYLYFKNKTRKVIVAGKFQTMEFLDLLDQHLVRSNEPVKEEIGIETAVSDAPQMIEETPAAPADQIPENK